MESATFATIGARLLDGTLPDPISRRYGFDDAVRAFQVRGYAALREISPSRWRAWWTDRAGLGQRPYPHHRTLREFCAASAGCFTVFQLPTRI
ncbi:hypothetical protein [Nonomuraea sp. B19D2]|uniref:hypothetical protein n=1 Tax=Nonomuraea sp. B19D2 TaxID=3159561 RepID=UPI0032D9EB32